MPDTNAATYYSIDPDTLDKRQSYVLQTSLLVPRPIAWVGTIGADGSYNCAPFSYFMGVSSLPPIIAFAVGQRRTGPKDTVVNIEACPEFTINIVSEAQAEAMVKTSADLPHGQYEFKLAGLIPQPSELIKAPRIANAPVQMECRLHQIVDAIAGFKVGVELNERIGPQDAGHQLVMHVPVDTPIPDPDKALPGC